MASEILVLLAVLSCSGQYVHGDASNCKGGVIVPEQWYVLDGESVVMTCVKYNAENNRLEGDVEMSANLSFLQGNEMVDARYRYQLNATAIKMKSPQLNKSYLDQSGVSINFRCFDTEECMYSIYVDVDYYPRVPVDVKCGMYQWEKMNCSWSLGVSYKHPRFIQVTADYILDNSDNSVGLTSILKVTNWTKCPKYVNNTGCIWEGDDFQLKRRLFLRVTVENTQRGIKVSTQNLSFITDEINEPAPVSPGKVHIKQFNSSEIQVRWKPYSYARNLLFNVTYTSQCTGSKFKVVYYKSKKRKRVMAKFEDLRPHSIYTFSIAGKYKPKHDPLGHWSKPSLVNFTTSDTVPLRSPETIDGLYDHIFPSLGNFTVYWKPLDTCELNSDSLKYIVTSDVATDILNHPSFSIQLMTENLPVKVTIQSSNNLGLATNTSHLTIFPESMAPNPSELIVSSNMAGGHSRVTLTIKEVKQQNPNICNISHVLVSCKRQYICQEPVQWEYIDGTSLTRPVTDFTRFGLITRGYLDDQLVTTGIVWQKCGYQVGQKPAKPILEEVNIETQPDGGFRVDWHSLDCSKDNTGYIQHFQVIYCKLIEEETCTYPRNFVNISKDETSYVKKEVPAGNRYRVWIKAVGENGMSSESEPVDVDVKRQATNRWLYACIIALSVIAVPLLVVLVCLCYRKCMKIVESKTQITCDALNGLDKLLQQDSSLSRNTSSSSDKHGSSSSKQKDMGDLCTDSGTSSLNSRVTEDSYATYGLLQNCDSDSLLNQDRNHTDEQNGKSGGKELMGRWINSDSHETLSQYGNACNLSNGTIMISMYEEVGDETDPLLEIETVLDAETEVFQDGSEDQTDEPHQNLVYSASRQVGQKVVEPEWEQVEDIDSQRESNNSSVIVQPLQHDANTETKEQNEHIIEGMGQQTVTVTDEIGENPGECLPDLNEEVKTVDLIGDKCDSNIVSSDTISCPDESKKTIECANDSNEGNRGTEEDSVDSDNDDGNFEVTLEESLNISFDPTEPLDGYERGLCVEDGEYFSECSDQDKKKEETEVDEDQNDSLNQCDSGLVLMSSDQSGQPCSSEITARTEGNGEDSRHLCKIKGGKSDLTKDRSVSGVVSPAYSSGDYQKMTLDSNISVG